MPTPPTIMPALAVLVLALGSALAPASGAELPPALQALPSGARILFQGDSITDGNRGRSPDPNHILGHGYQFIAAAHLGSAFPERKLVFINRGVSGNRVADLAQRWQQDALDLKPDLISILIGVNDFTHAADGGAPGAAATYEADYDALLTRSETALPGVHLVLGEPFLLPVGRFAEHFAEHAAALAAYQQAVARLARKHHAVLVHYQALFTNSCGRAPADYWIWDGVHPTYNGHGLMAEAWLGALAEVASP
jgi:lysophospholipase L1-like esterase